MQNKASKKASPFGSDDSSSEELVHLRDESRGAIDRVRSDLDAIEALLMAVRARQKRRIGPFPPFLPGKVLSRARNDVVLVLKAPLKGNPKRERPRR